MSVGKMKTALSFFFKLGRKSTAWIKKDMIVLSALETDLEWPLN